MPPLFIGSAILWVVNLFISVGQFVWDVIKAVTPFLHKIWDGIFFVIKKVGVAVGKFARATARFGRWLYGSVLSKVVPTLKQWWERFSGFIQKILKPVLEVIAKVTEALGKFWNKFVAPVLNWLEKARTVFSLLGKLGVGWAQWLADKIQTIINKIAETYSTVYTHITNIENFLNDLLTPEGWIKGKPFLLSIYRWGGGVVSIMVELGLDEELETRRRATEARRDIKVLPSRVSEFADLLVKQHPAVRLAVSDYALGKTKQGESTRG